MKRYILLLFLSLLFGQSVLATGPISLPQTNIVRRLKPSISYPIDLYQSISNPTDPSHASKYFTARTILRLGPGQRMTNSEQKLIRNEICASSAIYNQATENTGLALKWMPGSMGVYFNAGSILSIADQGLMGERLDTVLHKLANRGDAEKLEAAKYYAVAMVKNLEIIHRAGIIWKNARLRNFYVRPEGNLYAYDFSRAEKPATEVDASKEKEWKDFVVNTLSDMYRILFAQGFQPEFLSVVSRFNSSNNRDFFKQIWNEAALKIVLNSFLPGDVAPANRNQFGGLNSNYDVNAQAFLVRSGNIPYLPSIQPQIGEVFAKTDHEYPPTNILNGDNGFQVDPEVLTLTNKSAVGVPPAPFANLGELCNTWNGK